MGLVEMLRSMTMVVLVVGMVSLVDALDNTCGKSLVPCAAYLNSNMPPSPACCDPLKEIVANDFACICYLYNSPGFLAGLGLNITQAIRLGQKCGATGSTSNCNASSPNSQPSPPPGVPGGGNGSGAPMLVWTGIFPLLLLLWVSIMF